MQITNTQQLFQHIDSGAALSVGKDNTLQTQSSVQKFFQSVGDAFRQLSSSGRATIQGRNENLQTAMASLLSREAMPNLANLPPDQQSAPLNMLKNTALSRMEVAKHLHLFPQESRAEVGKLATKILQGSGKLNGTPAEARRAAHDFVGQMRSKPKVSKFCELLNTKLDSQQMQKSKEIISDLTRGTFQAQQHSIDSKTGLHDAFLKDYVRSSVLTVNGKPSPVGEQAGIDMLNELVPDPKIRAFVSMVASQAGLEGSVWEFTASPKIEQPSGKTAILNMLSEGVKDKVSHHKYDLSVEDGQVLIHLNFKQDILMTNFVAPPTQASDCIIGNQTFDLTMAIPQNQDMTGKLQPDFEIINFSMTSDS